MNITAQMVKELRDKTGVGMMDCKKALSESNGDVEKALEWLRIKGIAKGESRSARAASEGAVMSYIHLGGKIGVLCEVNCETDFVARGSPFQEFVKDVCMQIAASRPRYVKRQEVAVDAVEKERKIFEAEVRESGKPEKIVPEIVEGKLDKWYAEVCLLEQPYIKEPKQNIEQLRLSLVQTTGENIQIRRFIRYELGEGLEKKQDNLAEEIAKMTAAVQKD